MATKLNSAEAEGIVRRVKLLFLGFVVLLLGPMIVYAIYLDGRVDAVQKISSPTDLEGDDRPRSDLYHLDANPVEGQTVYVPAYSHVYHGAGAPYLLTITLSVRNTSLDSEISVTSVPSRTYGSLPTTATWPTAAGPRIFASSPRTTPSSVS